MILQETDVVRFGSTEWTGNDTNRVFLNLNELMCKMRKKRRMSREFWQYERRRRDIFSRRYCLHPFAGKKTCQGKIIQAHSIQKATSLTAIAENGHVLRFSADIDTLLEQGRPSAKKIGLGKASTFAGFCQKHDDTTFAELEKKPFVGTEEQCFLIGYRALVHELYKKRAGEDSIPHLVSVMARHADEEHREELARLLKGQQLGFRASRGWLEKIKEEWDQILMSKDYSQVRSAVISFSKVPDVMVSSCLFPVEDFDGFPFDSNIERLGQAGESPLLITYGVLSTTSGGAAVFCWLESSDYICNRFVGSLVGTRPKDRIENALVRLFFSYAENFYARPAWWRQLSQGTRQILLERFSTFASPTILSENLLMNDGIRYANWGEAKRSLRITYDGECREVFE